MDDLTQAGFYHPLGSAAILRRFRLAHRDQFDEHVSHFCQPRFRASG